MNFNATLIGQLIAFAVFVFFCMRKVFPHIVGAMEAREKKIADGLNAGIEAEKKLEQAEETAKDIIKKAEQQVGVIVLQANKRRDQIIDEANVKAMKERDLILKGAEAEILRMESKSREEMRLQVSTLAIHGAQKILEREVDSSDHQALIRKSR